MALGANISAIGGKILKDNVLVKKNSLGASHTFIQTWVPPAYYAPPPPKYEKKKVKWDNYIKILLYELGLFRSKPI